MNINGKSCYKIMINKAYIKYKTILINKFIFLKLLKFILESL